MLPGLLIGLWAQMKLHSAYGKYSQVPVEYDASARAKQQLFRLGLVHESERVGVSKVLDAAALTYVAALVNSVLQLLYYISAARNSRS